MAFEVELVDGARLDYHEIINWYEDQEPGLGRRFYSVIKDLFQNLELHP